jgi:hypothetical protein
MIRRMLVAALVASGCMRDQQVRLAHVIDSLRQAGAAETSEGRDPCTLVSRTEAEAVLGALRHDPYRVDGSGDPAPDGGACRYEAATGRHLVMDVSFDGAVMGMRVIGLGAAIASPVFGPDSARLAALHGHWDEARLIPGHLMARKGDAMVDLDYQGSGGGLPGAGRLADIALTRFASPLAYDGAAAARTAPGPLVTPRDPCSLVPRAGAEAILGALSGDPVSDGQENCTYTLAASRGLAGQEIQLTVQWRDGFAALDEARQTAALVERHMGVAPLMADSAGADSAAQRLQGMMQAGGIGTQMAPGGLRSDSAVAGPWDEASLVEGVTFSAVKRDVLMSVDLRTIPYDQARRLVAAAMQQL